MIPVLFFAALAAAAPSDQAPEQNGSPERRQYEHCLAQIRNDAAKAVVAAQAWQGAGGGIDARQCLGLAYMAQDRAAPAATTFEQAARAAEVARDGRVSDLWAQAGNAWLVAGDAQKARVALNAALGAGGGSDQWKGEIHIDRARANVELGDPAGARVDLDKALALVPADPMGWLLSATLARREGNLERAAKDIGEAERLAGDDPDVLVEAGNIAGMRGDLATARAKWTIAADKGKDTPAGKSAEAALAANPAE